MSEASYWGWVQSGWQTLINNAQLISDLGTFISAIVATVVVFLTRRQLQISRSQAGSTREQVEVARAQQSVAAEQANAAKLQANAASYGLNYQRNNIRSAELSRFDALAPQVYVVPLSKVDFVVTDIQFHVAQEEFFEFESSLEWVHIDPQVNSYGIWLRASIRIGNEGNNSSRIVFSDDVYGIPEYAIMLSTSQVEALLPPGDVWTLNLYKFYQVERLIEDQNYQRRIRVNDYFKVSSSSAINPDIVDGWFIKYDDYLLFRPPGRARKGAEKEYGDNSYKASNAPFFTSVKKKRSYPMLESPVVDEDLREELDRYHYHGAPLSSQNKKLLGF